MMIRFRCPPVPACQLCLFFFFSSRRRHTRLQGDWSSDVCSSDLQARFPYPYPLTFARSPANDGVIAALNRAWRLADTEVLCFLHNDTELSEPAWLARLLEALAEPRAGLAGVYGAKRLRAAGRAVGRTIGSSLLPAPTVRAPREDVAFVDSVCMCLPRDLMETVGGFDEGYGFYHGHDRDLSLAVLERGRRCLVVLAPFHHHGGRTRTRDFARDPAQERADLAMRDAALARFARKWRHRLPCHVRSAGQRMGDWLRTKSAPLARPPSSTPSITGRSWAPKSSSQPCAAARAPRPRPSPSITPWRACSPTTASSARRRTWTSSTSARRPTPTTRSPSRRRAPASTSSSRSR